MVMGGMGSVRMVPRVSGVLGELRRVGEWERKEEISSMSRSSRSDRFSGSWITDI